MIKPLKKRQNTVVNWVFVAQWISSTVSLRLISNLTQNKNFLE